MQTVTQALENLRSAMAQELRAELLAKLGAAESKPKRSLTPGQHKALRAAWAARRKSAAKARGRK